MYYRLYDGTWTICNWSGRRRASNFQSTLPRAHYPLYRSTEDRLFFAFFWTCIIHGYEDQDRVTITTGINIKIVLKLCNVGSMVKGGEDNWSFNLLGIIRIENNGSFTPLLNKLCFTMDNLEFFVGRSFNYQSENISWYIINFKDYIFPIF